MAAATPLVTIVAHDHDVFDLKRINCKFHHRQAIEIECTTTLATFRCTNNLARQQADDLIGGHTAIAAANPEVLRRLLLCSRLKARGARLDVTCPLAVLSNKVSSFMTHSVTSL